MKRAVNWLRRGAFGLGIAVALAFGAYQALGSTGMDPENCPVYPPSMGWCENQAHCQAMCDEEYGDDNTVGFCVYSPLPIDEFCCICIEIE